MIFAESPRRISIERAHEIAAVLPAFISLVAVFVDPPLALVDEALKMGCIPQFCGDESPESCEQATEGTYIKVFHLTPQGAGSSDIEDAVARYPHATPLFDSRVDGRHGGTGVTFDWERVRGLALQRPVIVSGGLTPENVGACVRSLQPHAVDVRSGVETNGRKDFERMRAFVQAVREASAES